MTLVERIGERLARRTSRREVVTKGAAAAFGVAAAWATQGPFGSGALAAACARRSPYPDCNPPFGQYCNAFSPSYCDGARCSGGCTLDPQYYPEAPQTGCWCTATRGVPGHRYYYVCCDCQCPGGENGGTRGCGCRNRVSIDPPTNPRQERRERLEERRERREEREERRERRQRRRDR